MLNGEKPIQAVKYTSPDQMIEREHGRKSIMKARLRDNREAKHERRTRAKHHRHMAALQAKATELRAYFNRANPTEWLELGPEGKKAARIPAEMDEKGYPLRNGKYPEVLGVRKKDDGTWAIRRAAAPYYFFRKRRRVKPNVEAQIEKLLYIFENDQQFRQVQNGLAETGDRPRKRQSQRRHHD